VWSLSRCVGRRSIARHSEWSEESSLLIGSRSFAPLRMTFTQRSSRQTHRRLYWSTLPESVIRKSCLQLLRKLGEVVHALAQSHIARRRPFRAAPVGRVARRQRQFVVRVATGWPASGGPLRRGDHVSVILAASARPRPSREPGRRPGPRETGRRRARRD